jgi:beta-N-acetylhexosaminidase
MTAHVFFPAFEKARDLPATLSRSVLTGLLRDKLGFKGILVTDDLEMGAITESYGIAQAATCHFRLAPTCC